MRKLFLTMLMIVGWVAAGWSQVTPPQNPFWELTKLNAVFADTGKISFNVAYYYEQADSSGISRDTVNGSYKLWGQKFYAMIDSNEVVQNETYNVSVDHPGQLMLVGSPKPVFPSVIQLNLIDQEFMDNYIDDITISDSGKTRKLSVVFKPYAPFSSYSLSFDTTTYWVKCIDFKIRGALPENDAFGNTMPLPNYYTQVKVVFTNFQTGAFAASVFDVSRFFKQADGVFVVNPPYSDYEIFDNGVGK